MLKRSEDVELKMSHMVLSTIVRYWKRWHLNGLNAGCEHQREQGWADLPIDPEQPTDTYSKHFDGQGPSIVEHAGVGLSDRLCRAVGEGREQPPARASCASRAGSVATATAPRGCTKRSLALWSDSWRVSTAHAPRSSYRSEFDAEHWRMRPSSDIELDGAWPFQMVALWPDAALSQELARTSTGPLASGPRLSRSLRVAGARALATARTA